jgi:hypothetical protein
MHHDVAVMTRQQKPRWDNHLCEVNMRSRLEVHARLIEDDMHRNEVQKSGIQIDSDRTFAFDFGCLMRIGTLQMLLTWVVRCGLGVWLCRC